MATLFWFDTYRWKNWLRRLLRPSWLMLKQLPHRTELAAARIAFNLSPLKSMAIDKDRLYPPTTVCDSTPTWVSENGGNFGATISRVDPACTATMALPKTIHRQIRRQFLQDQTYSFPETFVARLPNGRATKRGFVIAPDGQFLRDVSTYFHDPKISMETALSTQWRLQPLTEINGRVAVLATDGASLYYHWLFQLLPRIELLRLAGIHLSEIDAFYVNNFDSRFQRETLGLLGIEPSRIIEGTQVPYLRARELIVPSVPLGTACFRPWMVSFLRNAFLPGGQRDTIIPGRRLYISRGLASYRRVLNEDEVIALLKKRRFEVLALETMSISEQAAVMASCEAVVAPHGGGMSNIVFCSPGTKIVEIYCPELVATYYWKLSNALGLDYYYLLGQGSPATLEADYPQSWDSHTDIVVDLDSLERSLALAGIE